MAMTTNETMLELHKMIGGVKWDEEYTTGDKMTLALQYEPDPKHPLGPFWRIAFRKHEEKPEWESWKWGGSISDREAQALIKDAAIEWLNRDDQTAAIYAPGYPTGEGGFYEAWWVGVYGPKEMMDMGGSFPLPVRDILAFEQGPTLFEALHAAVEAVKESKDAGN